MNHPLIKMLRFELKSNYMMWIFNLLVSLSLILMFVLWISNSSNPKGIKDIYLILFALVTWLFTINSYQESTKSQTMQMYHLIPISRNVKFLSKQFITLFAFPVILISVTFIIVSIAHLFTEADVEIWPSSQKAILWLIIWIIGHSISTLLAIIFKKNKVLYSMLTYFVLKFGTAMLMIIFMFALKSFDFQNPFQYSQNNYLEIIEVMGTLTLITIFYGISYRLFFRRQL